ncbi:hypothetical protein [uncultured Hymenobacter sp.]|uniref:hypothetical protein n=1 Tax=uncultured Hymenobacter sp. TaxID=170016 RepID=UPI0035CADA8D
MIDTNIARAASESEHPTSDACRRLLELMIENEHKVVLSYSQYQEWLKHNSRFTKLWLRRMASEKLWHVLSPEPDSGLTDRTHKVECSDAARQEMLKDVHLLENALATDEIVLSLETNVFHLFCTHAQVLKISRPVAWVSPTDAAPAGVAWVAAGADVATARCIPAGS